MLQSFSGTPVIMFSCARVHPLPTQLFSIHRFWFASVMGVWVTAFCTNMAGCGFSEWCIISRWSFTRFCMASVDDNISWLVPKW